MSTHTAQSEKPRQRPQRATCRHCGTPFNPHGRQDAYCCAGCAYVAGLIQREGLDQFYALKDRAIDPVTSGVFYEQDMAWLRELAEEAEGDGRGNAELTLALRGITCIGCVWLIEKLFERRPGARRIDVNVQTGRMRLEWQPGAFDVAAFTQELHRYGYQAGPASGPEERASTRLLGRMGLCAAFALNAMLFSLPRYLGMTGDFPLAGIFDLVALLCATLSMAVGGTYFIERALRGLREGILHIDFPIALGVSAAWAGSLAGWLLDSEDLLYFDFVAIFVFLMLVGRWTQEFAIERNRSRLLRLSPIPRTVERAGPGAAAPIPVDALKPGEVFRVAPGQTVPVAASVRDAQASFSLQWITGEAEPEVYPRGRLVPSGAQNIATGPVELEAAESWRESFLERLSRETSCAENERSRVLEQVLRVYLGVVIATAAAGGLAWSVLAGAPLTAFQVFVSILVVSCPCALGVALPLANEVSISFLRRLGLYVRTAGLWARLANVRIIAFDKTGTLTLETLELENPHVLDALTPEARGCLHALCSASLHPLSRSLKEALLARYPAVQVPGTAPVSETPGEGLSLLSGSDGSEWRLGKPRWAAPTQAHEGRGTESVLARNGEVLAHFHFREVIREGAETEIAELRRQGKAVVILSGDRTGKVEAMARRLGLETADGLGGMSPQDKARWIEKAGAASVMMLGDGANDALAFDVAAVRGTPLIDRSVLEQRSDFFFTGRNLEAVNRLFAVARTRARTLRRVFIFAVAYNGGAVALCLAGWMNPLLAAILMPVSSLISVALTGFLLARRLQGAQTGRMREALAAGGANPVNLNG